MTIYFTADHHFGHQNIIKHCNRPYTYASDMAEALIEHHNAVVKPEDTVYHLGDLAGTKSNPTLVRSCIDQMNGKMHWVLGNHDKPKLVKKCSERFESVQRVLEIQIPDEDAPRNMREISLFHYSQRVWNKKRWGAWHLYGHSHNNLSEIKTDLAMDIGVDCWGYSPVSYEEIKGWMSMKDWKPPSSNR